MRGITKLVDSESEEYGTDGIIQVLKGDENQFDDLTLILLKRIE